MHARLHAGWLIASFTSSLWVACGESSDSACEGADSECSSEASAVELPFEGDTPHCHVATHGMCFEGAWDVAWKSMCEGEGGEVLEACPPDDFGVCDYTAHNGMSVLVMFYPPVTDEDAREMCRISSGTYVSN